MMWRLKKQDLILSIVNWLDIEKWVLECVKKQEGLVTSSKRKVVQEMEPAVLKKKKRLQWQF